MAAKNPETVTSLIYWIVEGGERKKKAFITTLEISFCVVVDILFCKVTNSSELAQTLLCQSQCNRSSL